jgi:hypothetical protein
VCGCVGEREIERERERKRRERERKRRERESDWRAKRAYSINIMTYRIIMR